LDQIEIWIALYHKIFTTLLMLFIAADCCAGLDWSDGVCVVVMKDKGEVFARRAQTA
jgi:hypothetical protein